MSELWIPQQNKKPDITNIFDMMMVFQEKIDSVWEQDAKIHEARIALRALAISLHYMDDDEKQITVVTGLAIIDDTEEEKKGSIVKEVGISGFIDDVHCIQVGATLPMAVSLGIETFTLFRANDPEAADIMLSNAKTPINSVRYIETHAA